MLAESNLAANFTARARQGLFAEPGQSISFRNHMGDSLPWSKKSVVSLFAISAVLQSRNQLQFLWFS
jgi:hypothetical protein